MADNNSPKPSARDDDPRAALAEAFFAAFLADWQTDGPKAIAAMRADKPGDYLKLVATLLPKEFAPNGEPIEERTDAEIAARIAHLAKRRAAVLPGGAGSAGDEEGA
jgi:hypothetical protein